MDETDGFEHWYRCSYPRLVRALWLITGDRAHAEDVVAETCSRALTRWSSVSEMTNPTGWAYTVAVNLARRQARRRSLLRTRVDGHTPPQSPDLDDEAIDVWRAVRSLPPRQRQAVALRYIGDLSEAEVAQAMGISVGTASATLSQARVRLGESLREGRNHD